MTLPDLLELSPEKVLSLSVQQVVALAGDGEIKDGSPALEELRQFLSRVPPKNLFGYARQCLDLTGYGYVLQDVVNELGRRLDFDVEGGLLKGKPGAIGFDGIWRSSEEPAIVVEVKTTDTYAIRLEDINNYRKKLEAQGSIPTSSSILIIVGREGTGALEAQIRGSEFSRNIRLLKVEGLIKLVQINSNADDPDATTKRIRKLLHPVEYIQLDNVIDVIFSTISGENEETQAPRLADDLPVRAMVDRTLLDSKRQRSVDAFSALKGCKLIPRSRTFFWSEDKMVRVCCTVSKRYENDAQRYFYAYHPKWDAFLEEGQGFLILCCLDLDEAFAVPRTWFAQNLQNLPVAESAGVKRWLLWLTASSDGPLAIELKDGTTYGLEPHKFSLQLVEYHGASG